MPQINNSITHLPNERHPFNHDQDKERSTITPTLPPGGLPTAFVPRIKRLSADAKLEGGPPSSTILVSGADANMALSRLQRWLASVNRETPSPRPTPRAETSALQTSFNF